MGIKTMDALVGELFYGVGFEYGGHLALQGGGHVQWRGDILLLRSRTECFEGLDIPHLVPFGACC
jgi:hypothetical protein